MGMGFRRKTAALLMRFVRSALGHPAGHPGAVFLDVADANLVSDLEIAQRGRMVGANDNLGAACYKKSLRLRGRELFRFGSLGRTR